MIGIPDLLECLTRNYSSSMNNTMQVAESLVCLIDNLLHLFQIGCIRPANDNFCSQVFERFYLSDFSTDAVIRIMGFQPLIPFVFRRKSRTPCQYQFGPDSSCQIFG